MKGAFPDIAHLNIEEGHSKAESLTWAKIFCR